MKHRERVLAAIHHKIPDRIPVDAICIENSEAIAQELQIPTASVYDKLDIDGRIIAATRYAGKLPVREGKTLSPWGIEERSDYGTANFYPLASASLSEIEHYPWPDANSFAFEDLYIQLQNWTDEYALRGPYWVSAPLFCTASNLMGMEEALCKMLLEPIVFDACLEHIFHFSCTYIKRFIETVGSKLDILYLADDFASQRGMLMDPSLWRKFLKPRYEQLFAIGKKQGLPIWFHSCGDITAVIPDLIDIGMDVWETVQLHALSIKPAELKQQYGQHITFFGGINTQKLPFMTPDEVADEVNRCIDLLGKNGGYICGPDHHIKPDVSARNVIALFNTARKYTKPCYTQNTEIA